MMANWWLSVFLYSLLLCLIGTSRTQEEDENVRTIVVEWSGTAVQQYTPDSPLEVNSGDKLIFQCPNGSFSNLWYQPAIGQYNSCDCTVGRYSPNCIRIGECIGAVKNFTQNINANSGDLATVAVYEPGQMYYFTSFSDGTFFGAISENRRTDGECEELRMAIRVLDAMTTTEPSPESSPSTFGPSSGNGNTETPATPGDVGGLGGNGDGGGNTNVGGPGETSTDVDVGSGNENYTIRGEVGGVSGGSMNSYSQFITYCSVVLCTIIVLLQRH